MKNRIKKITPLIVLAVFLSGGSAGAQAQQALPRCPSYASLLDTLGKITFDKDRQGYVRVHGKDWLITGELEGLHSSDLLIAKGSSRILKKPVYLQGAPVLLCEYTKTTVQGQPTGSTVFTLQRLLDKKSLEKYLKHYPEGERMKRGARLAEQCPRGCGDQWVCTNGETPNCNDMSGNAEQNCPFSLHESTLTCVCGPKCKKGCCRIANPVFWGY